MGNAIGLEGWPGIIDGTIIGHSLLGVKPAAHVTAPAPSLHVHGLVALSLEPAFPLLVQRVLRPGGWEGQAVGRRREGTDEGGEGEVVVAAEEDVALPRVLGGEGEEEVDDLAGVGAAVTVIAEEDDEGSGEGIEADDGLEVGPEGTQLGDVSVDVPDAEHRPVACGGFAHLSHLITQLENFGYLNSL